MRLWSVSPDQLDRAALVAGWREGLLAQKVLLGRTKGYRSHPQLHRFRALDDPVAGIATWLHGLADAADARNYRFDRTRVVLPAAPTLRMEVSDGQLAFEWAHLSAKVMARDPQWAAGLAGAEARAHPMFDVVPGPIAEWERPG
ncbi:hypothetical protein SAMN05421595_2805 [Austwickia chelonae]|uniref:DNA lyase n=1 Tax=Austwickia chelonae NBRC 105200 TaxID=1184607 RepID=K6VPA3_9MICO|nr:pyrimidine dimer DNA glycosylase/endonuclease V [Austwickia chelonae]GAB78529.1 hypothetical protein AUCHE_09_01340 [Austwickia chelonae NBRC 105200]SEW40463.1 hypothetical protein SAMN05421595_2805 [Austwickia chelonae]